MGTPRLFSRAKACARGIGPDTFFERDEARRRFLQSHLYQGFAERVGARIGRTAGWVYRRLEGHAAMSPALEQELLLEIPPEQAVRRLREDAARLRCAVAQIPGPRNLQASPALKLAEAIPALAAAAESALDALVDQIVTLEEAAHVKQDADRAVTLTLDAVASMEVAAGRRLL